LALWKITNEEDAVLIPKIRSDFPADLHSEFLWGGFSRYAATPMIITLSPGHSKITKLRTWTPIETGNPLDRAEKIENLV
jgi:hypothetical protein